MRLLDLLQPPKLCLISRNSRLLRSSAAAAAAPPPPLTFKDKVTSTIMASFKKNMSFKTGASFKRIASLVRGGHTKVSDLVSQEQASSSLSSVLAVTHTASKWRSVLSASKDADANSFSHGADGRAAHWKELGRDDRTHINVKLRKACAGGIYNRVRLLLDQGASLTQCDEAFERTPLHFAAMHGHTACVKYLMSRGADPRATDLSNMTALHIAAEYGFDQVIAALVEGGADLLAKTTCGNLALHHSAYNAHKQATCLLIHLMKAQQGLKKSDEMDISALKNNWGKSPTDLASEKGHKSVVRLLERRKD